MRSSLVVRLERCPYASKWSFRDRRRRGPESMNTGLWNMDSGPAALRRPGMMRVDGGVDDESQGQRGSGPGRSRHGHGQFDAAVLDSGGEVVRIRGGRRVGAARSEEGRVG